MVAGESAGGNLAAAVALRLRDAGDVTLAGQVLIYPQLSGRDDVPVARSSSTVSSSGSSSGRSTGPRTAVGATSTTIPTPSP